MAAATNFFVSIGAVGNGGNHRRWRIALMLALVLCASSAGAQDWFFGPAQPVAASFAGAREVRFADLDRDGDLDVVATSEGDDVAWFENTAGDGSTFTLHYVSQADGAGRALSVGDINGDGAPDVVVGKTGTDDVYWYDAGGVPTGTWTRNTVLGGPFDDPTHVEVVDIDQDGDLDVVVGANGTGLVHVRLNDGGTGAAWTPGGNNLGASVARLVVGDPDMDGDLDILAAGQGADTVQWNRNDGGTWVADPLLTGINGAWGIDAGDLDLDGDLDLVATAQEGDELVMLEGDGSGFSSTAITIDDDFDGARDVRLVDLDVDGDLDVIAIAQFDGKVVMWENRLHESSARGASPWVRWELASGLPQAWSFDLGDLDGDGDDDLVVAVPFTGDRLIWFENRAPRAGWDYDGSTVELASSPSALGTFALGDVNRDGAIDVIAGGTVRWWHGERSDTPAAVEPIGGVGFIPTSIALADIDGDGDPDVAGAGGSNSTTSDMPQWENLGGATPSWDFGAIASSNLNADNLIVADLLGIGKRSVVTSGPDFGTSVRVCSPPYFVSGGSCQWLGQQGANDMAVGDLDRDGDLDVVLGGEGFHTEAGLVWIEQVRSTGSPTVFTKHTIMEDEVDALALIDWDSDGDLDVVAVNQSPGQILIVENRLSIPGPIRGGDPWVADEISLGLFPADPSFDDVVAGDFNRDGSPDILVNSTKPDAFNGSEFVVLVEARVGSWASLEIDIGAERLLDVGDTDHDGDLDLALLDLAADEVVRTNLHGDVYALRPRIDIDDSTPGPTVVPRGTETWIASARLDHEGLAGNAAMELRTLRLYMEQRVDGGPRLPVDAAGVDRVLARVRVLIDDGDGTFDPLVDTEALDLKEFTFEGDRLLVELPDESLVAPMDTNSVWCYLLITLEADAPDVLEYVVKLDPQVDVVAQDSEASIRRGNEPTFEVGFAVPLIEIFADGFETGDTTAWTSP